MDAEAIQNQVESLRARFASGGLLDAETRASCAATLETLRGVWRNAPDLFRQDVMLALKEISAALRSPGPIPLTLTNQSIGDRRPAPPGGTSSMPGSRMDGRASKPRLFSAGSASAALKAIFGFDRFRPGQEEIISAVLSGRDCIGVMPTGAGKSLTYQIPARLLGGTT